MTDFRIESDFQPAGDQPQAIEALVAGLEAGRREQVLMGVTGSGKTFTMAQVIARWGRPTLVVSHNKTLAAQLYAELRAFLPANAVEYFVSYYDYYQPEAYIPQRDIYIEKDASINDRLDRLRLSATSSVMARRDVVVVASVSCLYGLGSPEDYRGLVIHLQRGQTLDRDELVSLLIQTQYRRNDFAFERGQFRVRGDVLELRPAYGENALRLEFFGDELEALAEVDPLTGEVLERFERFALYPAKHFVSREGVAERALTTIAAELEQRLAELRRAGKELEAQRLEARTRYDLEMLEEVGHVGGIENYARHFTGKAPGQRPYCLIDYFPRDLLIIIDESHATLPQIRAMWHGDRSRKQTLVEHGFRLPSALDNRPMTFEEFAALEAPRLYVSATPGPYELAQTGGEVVSQVIRPTGLVDPAVRVEPAAGQVAHLTGEIARRVEQGDRVLVTTLTKRQAEDLSAFLAEKGVRCQWLHSELDALERVQILTALRQGDFDVLVGVNLLREGLDLPEVSLVAILDADKAGFLRSQTSLIQTIGRTARNIRAEVILYADRMTEAMSAAMDETARRRAAQLAYNQEHGIIPRTVSKAIRCSLDQILEAETVVAEAIGEDQAGYDLTERIRILEEFMFAAAAELDFEKAARLRDEVAALRAAGPGPARSTGERARRAHR